MNDRLSDNSFASKIDVGEFADVELYPAVILFKAALATARSVDPDMIVWMEGSGSMDVAKTTGVMYEQTSDILEHVVLLSGDGKMIPTPSLLVVAIQ